MTIKEIENLTDSLTEEYERYKYDLTIEDYIKDGFVAWKEIE